MPDFLTKHGNFCGTQENENKCREKKNAATQTYKKRKIGSHTESKKRENGQDKGKVKYEDIRS